MSVVDWNRLAPHVPATGAQYHAHHDSLSVRLFQRLSARNLSAAVIGPAGIGKSSEIGMLLALLKENRPCSVGYLLDHDPSGVRQLLAASPSPIPIFHTVVRILRLTLKDQLPFSDSLSQRLEWLGVSQPGAPTSRYVEALRDLLSEFPQQRPVVLLDGLDRQDDASIQATFEAFDPFLSALDLVVVLPPRWAVQGSRTALPPGFLVESVRPVPVRPEHAPSWRDGLQHMEGLVLAHLGLTSLEPAEASIVLRAAEASGGVPRVFLQLLLDASFYASVAKRTWPNEDDLRQAMRDQVSALRRILMPGDLEALQRARGTDGLEIDPDRRIRFLSHGLLLEYGQAEDIRVFPTPLLEGLLALRSAA